MGARNGGSMGSLVRVYADIWTFEEIRTPASRPQPPEELDGEDYIPHPHRGSDHECRQSGCNSVDEEKGVGKRLRILATRKTVWNQVPHRGVSNPLSPTNTEWDSVWIRNSICPWPKKDVERENTTGGHTGQTVGFATKSGSMAPNGGV